MREWLTLDERSFHEAIVARMRATGSVGDVIPAMITYNVPGFILKELWPAAFAEWLARPVFMAFAVAEEGWAGRIDNIHSKVRAVGDGFELEFAKSYVISCEAMLVLARDENGGELVLCRLPRSDLQTWASRQEPGVLLTASDGTVYDHFRVSGKEAVKGENILPLTRRQYTPFGIRIPRRELSSLALISVGALDFLGIAPGGADGALLQEKSRLVLEARAAGRLGGTEMAAAVQVLDVFFRATEDAGAQIHPFWEFVRKMRDRFDR